MAFTYILRCEDDSYYVGSCRNLDYRMWQHSTGKGSKYTGARMPVTLVFAQEFGNIGDAYALEKQVQGWSRAKREALIRGEFENLPGLSRNRSGSQPPAG